MADRGSTLGTNQALYEGDYLSSGNGYYAVMQNDGNFVLYSTMHWIPHNAAWASGTNGKGAPGRRIIMQSDGNLVIYDSYNSPIWASNTCQSGSPPFRLVMQTDRNLVIYDGYGSATWATGTNI